MDRPLNLFYKAPDPDRWIPYDRYPRRLVRWTLEALNVREPIPSGQQMVYENLKKGLDRAGIPYRDNDFRYIRRHPDELACIIGKPFLLDDRPWSNPILFGASVFSHPIDYPDLFEQHPNVHKILVPGDWIRDMFREHYPDERVVAWPVGIDVDAWSPEVPFEEKDDRVLVYDKVRWDHDAFESTLINPVIDGVKERDLDVDVLRYGSYLPPDLKASLRRCKAVVFLCEHETQGLAYQQMLSAGVPIFAWDRGGYWQDPNYYPDPVRFGAVSSVPYWDERCGMKFEDATEFEERFDAFWKDVQGQAFDPRSYVVENLTLEQCARHYARIAKNVRTEVAA